MQKTLHVASALLISTLLQAQAAVPTTLPFQGRLTKQAGGAVTATVSLTFRIWASGSGGTALWTETQQTVAVAKGLFKVELGGVTGFPATLFSGGTLYLSVQMAGDAEMLPRLAITSQAYAQLAKNATDDRGNDIHPRSVSIGTTPVIDNTGWQPVEASNSSGTTILAKGVGVLPMIEARPAAANGVPFAIVFKGTRGDSIFWAVGIGPSAPVVLPGIHYGFALNPAFFLALPGLGIAAANGEFVLPFAATNYVTGSIWIQAMFASSNPGYGPASFTNLLQL